MSMNPELDRHEAILGALHLIAKEIRHMANTEAQALADLQSAVTDLGAAIAAEITALQNAMNAQGVNNTPAIEASVTNIRSLIGGLNASIAATTTTPPAAAPVITSISPTSGPLAGGTSVTVTGTGLTKASGVTVGGLAGVGLVVASDTSLSFNTPASVAGPAAVVVTGPGGSSTGTTTFTYAAAPAAPTPAPGVSPATPAP
jgi:hypothetical protein